MAERGKPHTPVMTELEARDISLQSKSLVCRHMENADAQFMLMFKDI